MRYRDEQAIQDKLRAVLADVKSDKTLDSVLSEISLVDELYGHSMNVAKLGAQLAIEIGMSDEEARDIALAGIFHDAGKIRTPKDILFKQGTLSPAETAVVRKHPVDGYELCRNTMLDERVLDIILNHHEKNGGTGYPNGLRTVSPYVSVITVADIFSALIEPRSYHRQRGVMEALSFIAVFDGLDRDLVQRLYKLIETD